MTKNIIKIVMLLILALVCAVSVFVISVGSILLGVTGLELIKNGVLIVLGAFICFSSIHKAKKVMKEVEENA